MKNRYWLLAISLVIVSCQTKSTSKNQSIDNTMTVQYAYTILYVEDVPATMSFYQEAFGFKEKFLTPEKDYGELITGTTTLAFANLALANSNFSDEYTLSQKSKPPFGIELALTTSDVQGLMQKAVTLGATIFAEAKTKPWGQEVGYLRDINGFLLEICTPINPNG